MLAGTPRILEFKGLRELHISAAIFRPQLISQAWPSFTPHLPLSWISHCAGFSSTMGLYCNWAVPLPGDFPGLPWHQAIVPLLLSMTVSILVTPWKLRLQRTPRKSFPDSSPWQCWFVLITADFSTLDNQHSLSWKAKVSLQWC